LRCPAQYATENPGISPVVMNHNDIVFMINLLVETKDLLGMVHQDVSCRSQENFI
jgi:hypothetical protein